MQSKEEIFGLFPGQGSQKVGMGKELFDSSETARRLFGIADEVLGFALSKICFEGPSERLTQTEVTQPAILTVSVICYQALLERLPGFRLSAAAGHSLGEYSALVATQAIRFEDAVLLVHKRGKYMQEAVPAGVGKMAAILSREVSEIEEAISKVSNGIVQIANVNSPGQIVIAGNKEAVDDALRNLAGAKAIELPVSAPFHCALMKPAEERLAKDLAELPIRKAQAPVYANYSAQPLSEPEQIREALRLQVCGRVRWVECMENAIRDTTPVRAIEFGNGSVLTGMLKRINPKLERTNLDSLTAIARYAELTQAQGQSVSNL